MLIIHLLYNCIDFLILRKYLLNYSPKRSVKALICKGIYVLCVFMLSIVNSSGNPNLNVLASLFCIYIYSCTFENFRCKGFLQLSLYIGVGFIAEPIGFLLTQNLLNIKVSFYMSYMLAAGISLFVRFMVISNICKFRKIRFQKMTLTITLYLVLIIVLGILECCIAIWVAGILQTQLSELFGIVVITIVLLINLLEFLLLEKYQKLLEDTQQNEILLQEANAKETYYSEIDKNNCEIRRIKHDLINRLTGIISVQNKDLMIENILSIVNELKNVEKKIYTSNIVFNTILNTKMQLAEEANIKCNISVFVPKRINMDYGDAGILLGNLMDNCIEACQELPLSNRWIDLKIIYQNKMMLIKLANSKSKFDKMRRQKRKNNQNHGFGLKSVKAIIEKHGGTIDILDSSECYEVSVVLYGLKDDKDYLNEI